MRDEILLEYATRIRENIETCKAFASAAEQMKKELNIAAVMKTLKEAKELADYREQLILSLLEYIENNYND